MNRVFLEAAYRLELQKDLTKAWNLVVTALAAHKISHVIYVVRDDGPVPNWFVLSNLPDSWPKPLTHDPNFNEPFVARCCATFEVSKLGTIFLENHEPYIDDQTRDYVTTVSEFDLHAGLGIPCSLKGANRYGGFILGNNSKRHGFERSIMPLADQLQTFCLIAHRKFDECRVAGAQAETRRRLSAREHQVLELIAAGHRPKAIAQTLSLSEASIRLYIKNARLKLGVSTNGEAISRFLQ
ncbi:Response regulator (plasmid) [Phaeobacter inhibens]|uniref:Response regulator n=1 Tax=Phaeobacter inhibens TaxID=221822 RepID=A0ABN5GV68_9RHOB|nr:LuxR family transcriptional regulator [Phaeobacter inhibens]AUQ52344.1 Response regulator [Phaeobacter inhibens]AUQ96949.1 Response regulator [Phaeobacter inhibens]AUR22149.1 Response regulator [Phaeobacter inhibens]UWR83256.1 LuxR family transcriptional regulator [Phaeobacter inhibens]UWR92648.1 LuxR family transcriptional regulator [Phaeobacter inhibens]